MRSHRWQPTRLPHPWDSPGKNTGVGCHFLLQWMKVKSESEVAQSCPTLSNPMDCSPPDFSIHGIFQARLLEERKYPTSVYFTLVLYLPVSRRWKKNILTWSRYFNWRRQWHPTPVVLPGKSHRWRSLEGYSPWGCKELDTTKQQQFKCSTWYSSPITVLLWLS